MAVYTTTVAAFRKSKPKAFGTQFVLLDADLRPTLWYPADPHTIATDNGRTFLRDALGRGIQRVDDGLRQASMLNMRPNTNITDRLQRYVSDLTEEEYGTALYWQHGQYAATDVDLGASALKLNCLEGRATFYGERIFRWSDGGGNVLKLENLGFRGYGKKEYAPGMDDNDPILKQNVLLYGKGVAHILGCHISENPTNSIVLEGWQSDAEGKAESNVSGSIVSGNIIARSGGWGLLVEGNNANGVTNTCNDYRESGGGSRDSSQVGGFCHGNVYHPNPLFGDNVMDGTGCTGRSEGNYYEQRDYGKGNRYGGNCRVRDAHRNGVPEVGPNVDFKDANHPYVWRKEKSGGYGLYPTSGEQVALVQYGPPGVLLQRPATNDVRLTASFYYTTDGTITHVFDTLEQARKADVFYQAGDRLTIRYPAEGEATAYVVATGGNGGRTLSGVLAGSGPSSGGQLVVVLKGQKPWGEQMPESAPVPSELKALIGTVVTLQGYSVRVWDVVYNKNNGFVLDCPRADLISITDGHYPSGELRYATPVFEPLSAK